MKKYFIFLILFIVFISITAVTADNDTDKVIATEDGDSNISFTNDYKGYCIEWGEHSAKKGDVFTLDDNVDNRIKVFFVYFYEDTQKDVIATQHMIWKFSDNKQFSRFNQTLYDQIMLKSNEVTVPNHGSINIDNKTQMVFDFKNLIASDVDAQNFFGYRIFFQDIPNIPMHNETVNNTTMPPTPNVFYDVFLEVEQKIVKKVKIFRDSSISDDLKSMKSTPVESVSIEHQTGNDLGLGCFVILLFIAVILSYRRPFRKK